MCAQASATRANSNNAWPAATSTQKAGCCCYGRNDNVNCPPAPKGVAPQPDPCKYLSGRPCRPARLHAAVYESSACGSQYLGENTVVAGCASQATTAWRKLELEPRLQAQICWTSRRGAGRLGGKAALLPLQRVT